MDRPLLMLAGLILVLQFALPTSDYFLWTAKGFLLLFMLPVTFLLLTKKSLADFGLNSGGLKRSVFYAAILVALGLPFLLHFSSDISFKAYYPIWEGELDFFTAELLLFPAMLGTEFFFRGFLLNWFAKKMDWRYAIILQALIYGLIHLGKPVPEAALSFLAGIVFGYVALRTRSILPSMLGHYSISVVFDLLQMS